MLQFRSRSARQVRCASLFSFIHPPRQRRVFFCLLKTSQAPVRSGAAIPFCHRNGTELARCFTGGEEFQHGICSALTPEVEKEAQKSAVFCRFLCFLNFWILRRFRRRIDLPLCQGIFLDFFTFSATFFLVFTSFFLFAMFCDLVLYQAK